MIDKQALHSLDKRQRTALVNSLPGFKPVVLVGSVNDDRRTNLCVINSCFHVGADPALMGMIIRPAPEGTERHTLENILATKTYSVSAVTRAMAQRAHHTSARFDRDQSEFDACGFVEQWHENFPASFSVTLTTVRKKLELETFVNFARPSMSNPSRVHLTVSSVIGLASTTHFM